MQSVGGWDAISSVHLWPAQANARHGGGIAAQHSLRDAAADKKHPGVAPVQPGDRLYNHRLFVLALVWVWNAPGVHGLAQSTSITTCHSVTLVALEV